MLDASLDSFFHTLLYYIKTSANIRIFSEKHGIWVENRRIWVEFSGKIEEFILRSTTKRPVFSVIFGRFQSFSVIPGEKQRKLENFGENHSFSFFFIPFHYTNTRIWVENSGIWVENKTFSQKYLAVPNILLIFATANKDDSSLSGRATVSPMASCRRLFLCQRISSQLENFIFLTGKMNMAAAWTVKICFVLSDKPSSLLATGNAAATLLYNRLLMLTKMMHYAEFYFY